jgi:hypothetical protein
LNIAFGSTPRINTKTCGGSENSKINEPDSRILGRRERFRTVNIVRVVRDGISG